MLALTRWTAATLFCLATTLSAAQAADKIVISNWDAYMPADLLENFTKETGIEAELSLHATNEEIMGKVTAGGGAGYDVIFVTSPFVEALVKLGLAAELDHAKIPNLANLYPEARALAYDPGLAHSVPYAWGTTGLCYRSDLVEGSLDSWWDLLRPSEEPQGQDHHARHGSLALAPWLQGAWLFRQHDRRSRACGGARRVDRGEADPARL